MGIFYKKSDIPDHLQKYFVPAEIGLEQTPDEYVAEMVKVFREVRRVLRDDGTLWLNLGDSYNNRTKVRTSSHQPALNGFTDDKWADRAARGGVRMSNMPGLKEKDLIGIPWAVATALRDPYYTGRIKNERDRVWIAAMIDGKGTICGFRHVSEDGSPRTGVRITITNSSTLLLDEAHRIWPASRSEQQRAVAGHLGWTVHGTEDKMLFLREVYPYLVAKKRQAMVAYNLLLIPDAKVGHSSGRDTARDKRAFLVQMLSDLNQGRPVDMPSWLVEPPSLFEPGFYLRQDIIWAKTYTKPESVKDRCTKAHEYIFLLSKSKRYFYDHEAVKEDAQHPEIRYKNIGRCGTSDDGKRNRRSVWTVATSHFNGAHFATFSPALIEPCILAGCPADGTVLDPFNGAGTTGLVCQRLGRNYIGIELNPEYLAITRRRLGLSEIVTDTVYGGGSNE